MAEDIMAQVAEDTRWAGSSRRFEFENGYGASVITGIMTMGADFELAVLWAATGQLVYDTPVTSDVERGDYARMNELLGQIKALPEPVLRSPKPKR